MKKITEKISIIIRTKNEERWIEQCLKKIFDQSYDNFEVIIVDNNSKDNTLQKTKTNLDDKLIEEIIDVWLNTSFEGGRHLDRINKIEND